MLTRVQSLMACLLFCWAPWTACSEERSNDLKDPRSHWAFRPPVQRESSNPAPLGWEKTAIDRLIAQRHHERGLRAQPGASPETWIRRVSYDLIGLPPTSEQVDAFVKACDNAGLADSPDPSIRLTSNALRGLPAPPWRVAPIIWGLPQRNT